MSQVRAQDRLQPALLDRLTDDDPQSLLESNEQRVMSRGRLREAVLRDLSWLLNTTALSGEGVLDSFPQVLHSVLNYGLPPLSGLTVSSIDPPQLEAFVRRAILDYEPRILAESLHVEMLMFDSQLDHHNQIGFRISGQLWAQPVPLELMLHTHLDLETGRIEIKELAR